MHESHIAMAFHQAAELPPMYSELLSSARRMLQRAESRAWSDLLCEEMKFFKAFERVTLHERAPRPEVAGDCKRELREEVHKEVRRHVRRSRELLVARQVELERELRMESVGDARGCFTISSESMPLPV